MREKGNMYLFLVSVSLMVSSIVAVCPAKSGSTIIDTYKIPNIAFFEVQQGSPEYNALFNNDGSEAQQNTKNDIQSGIIQSIHDTFSSIPGYNGVSDLSIGQVGGGVRRKRQFDVLAAVTASLSFLSSGVQDQAVNITTEIQRQLQLAASTVVGVGGLLLGYNAEAEITKLQALSFSFTIRFIFFSRANPTSSIHVSGGNISSVSQFVKTKKTIFIVHGFTDSGYSTWLVNMKNNLLNQEDANVICVDWGQGAAAPNYILAASNTKAAGKSIADLLTSAGVDRFNKAYCIGHSLGSHVCGYAGKNGQFWRITGMDPAGPLFIDYSSSNRLDKADARYVDIIHSDAGTFGINKTIGHKDFWPSGGSNQPGCSGFTLDPSLIISSISCSHGRAVDFYIESILSSSKFDSKICDNMLLYNFGLCFFNANAKMGYYAWSQGPNGTYMLNVNSQSPYSIS